MPGSKHVGQEHLREVKRPVVPSLETQRYPKPPNSASSRAGTDAPGLSMSALPFTRPAAQRHQQIFAERCEAPSLLGSKLQSHFSHNPSSPPAQRGLHLPRPTLSSAVFQGYCSPTGSFSPKCPAPLDLPRVQGKRHLLQAFQKRAGTSWFRPNKEKDHSQKTHF